MLTWMRPYLRHCGESWRPAWHIGRRRLLDFLLVYVDGGRGKFSVDDDVFGMESGDLFWTPAGAVTEMEGFAPGMFCVYLHFDLIYRPEVSHWDFSIPAGMLDLGEVAPLMHPPLPEGPVRGLRGRIRGPGNHAVSVLMREACGEAARGQPFAALRISALIQEIVALILRMREGAGATGSEALPALEEGAALLRQQCHRNVRVEEAARAAGLSPGYFRKLFHMHYACSPREYLHRARIQLAKQFMMEHRLNLSQIATRCGFATVHNLSRAFKASEGRAPSEYRRFGRSHIRVESRKTPYVR